MGTEVKKTDRLGRSVHISDASIRFLKTNLSFHLRSMKLNQIKTSQNDQETGAKDNENNSAVLPVNLFGRRNNPTVRNTGPLPTASVNATGSRRQLNERHRNGKVFPMSTQTLEKFLSMSTDDAITAIDKSSNSFGKLVKHWSVKEEVTILLIEVIGGKLCGPTSLPEMQRNLIGTASTPEILLKFRNYVYKLKSSSNHRRTHHRSEINESCFEIFILEDLCSYYSFVVARLQGQDVPWVDVQRNLIATSYMVKTMIEKKRFPDDDNSLQELLKRFDSMVLQVQRLQQTFVSNKDNDRNTDANNAKPRISMHSTEEEIRKLYLVNPPNNFLEFPTIPTMDEILSAEEPYLWPNLVKGRYPSALKYLDVQYRLLREDFLGPLRDSLLELVNNNCSEKKGTKPGKLRFYEGVRFSGMTVEEEKTSYSMKFSSPCLTVEEWSQNSNWLLPGSLVLLSADQFRTAYFATVDSRDERELSKGFVDIVWEGPRPTTYDKVSFLMLESETYFVSYRYTMSALQLMAQPGPPHYDKPLFKEYPMAKYIVDASSSSDCIPQPRYLRETNHLLDFSMLLTCNAEEIDRNAIPSSSSKEIESIANSGDSSVELDPYSVLKPKTSVTAKLKLKSHKADPKNIAQWPAAEEMGMDKAQHAAFCSAMTQELCIIQGPPGTGKTYIGLQLMKLLLSNPNVTKSPIFIVCRTNHALDQFLEGIVHIMRKLQIDPLGKLIRVGGGSRTEALSSFNLRQIRNAFRELQLFDEPYAKSRGKARAELCSLQDQADKLKDLYREICHPKGIVDFGRLAKEVLDVQTSYGAESILPRSLLNIFLKPGSESTLLNWLEITKNENQIFGNANNFVPEHLIQNWFSASNSCTEADASSATLQDVDINRLKEEVFLQADEQYYSSRKLPYLFGFYNNNFADRQVNLNFELMDAQRQNNLPLIQTIEDSLKKLKHERLIFGNKHQFLEQLFEAVENKRIHLPKSQVLKASGSNPDCLSISEKWTAYFQFVEETKTYLLKAIIEVEKKTSIAQEKFHEIKTRGDGIILAEALVVGMTTTGAAKYGTWVRMIQPKIVIIEEAAEVLESHIVTSITEYCQHLILIGDHKQLKPQTSVYKLSKDYHFDLSLFERLINNGMSWCCLKTQHRMRPDICKLLVPTIYSELENHPDVLKYPNVAGFEKNLFFFHHREHEVNDRDTVTKSNRFEARFIVKLCRHIILQNYQTSQVTILVTYNGQKALVEQLMMDEGEPYSEVRVATVDNFQGEENDIILVSLVRSNEDNNVGFLHTENRICVALSRARIGFYLIGNMDCLRNSKSVMWSKIYEELESQNSIGEELALKCQIHGEAHSVSNPVDFEEYAPEGGCRKKCTAVLPSCSHHCGKFCHVIDRDHLLYKCTELVTKVLPCGHEEELPCYWLSVEEEDDEEERKCIELVQKTLLCGHTGSVPCYLFPDVSFSKNCQQLVIIEFPCGHEQEVVCHERFDATALECDQGCEGPLEADSAEVFMCTKVTLIHSSRGRGKMDIKNNKENITSIHQIEISNLNLSSESRTCSGSGCSLDFVSHNLEWKYILQDKILFSLTNHCTVKNDSTRGHLKGIQVPNSCHTDKEVLSGISGSAYTFLEFTQFLEKKLTEGDSYTNLVSLYVMTKWLLEAEANVNENCRSSVSKVQTRFQRLKSSSPLEDSTAVNVYLPQHRDDLISEYKSVFEVLMMTALPLTPVEVDKFDREFDRLNDLKRLFIRRNINQFYFFRGTIPAYNTIKEHLVGAGSKRGQMVYDDGRKKQFLGMLKELEGLVKSDWEIPEENVRQEIGGSCMSMCPTCLE